MPACRHARFEVCFSHGFALTLFNASLHRFLWSRWPRQRWFPVGAMCEADTAFDNLTERTEPGSFFIQLGSSTRRRMFCEAREHVFVLSGVITWNWSTIGISGLYDSRHFIRKV